MENKILTFKKLNLFTLGFIIIASFYGNVLIHEFGHYVIADALGLKPRLYLFDNGQGTGFSFTNQNFYVTYNKNGPDNSLVALGGPLANLILCACISLLYFKIPKRNENVKIILFIIAIVTLLSGILNLLPYGTSDGKILFNMLKNL
ncbi:MAG: hypothetical protein QW625_00990 [Candidatus Nanoarchaeia archaeon]